MTRFSLLLMMGFSLLVTPATADESNLDQAVAEVNVQVRAKGLSSDMLITAEDVKYTIEDQGPWEVLRGMRDEFNRALKQGRLPSGVSLALEVYPDESMIQITYPLGGGFTAGLLVKKNGVVSHEIQRSRDSACNPADEKGYRLCQEPFAGELPAMASVDFPSTVRLKISQTQATGPHKPFDQTALQGDVLRIQLLLKPENLADVARYFAVGFDSKQLLQTLWTLLGAQKQVWIDLQELFPGWTAKRTNTFVVNGDNDVCHAAAREFFWPDPSPHSVGSARSTEAVEVLLHDFYCPLPDQVSLRFGDYLWIPQSHSGRYVLTDPESGRGVVWSVQSGGAAPYRFYWMDEDFSGDPFAHKPLQNLRQTQVDAWRRCK